MNCEPFATRNDRQGNPDGVRYDVRLGELDITTITVTQARKKLYTLVDDVSRSHEPVQIAGKRHAAVLIGEDDWRAIQETLYLTSIPGMKNSIIRGLKTPLRKCHREPGW